VRSRKKEHRSEKKRAHTLAASDGLDASWAGADVKEDEALEPRHEEVGALANHVRADTRDSVEDDCTVSTLDVVHAAREKGNNNTHTHTHTQ